MDLCFDGGDSRRSAADDSLPSLSRKQVCNAQRALSIENKKFHVKHTRYFNKSYKIMFHVKLFAQDVVSIP